VVIPHSATLASQEQRNASHIELIMCQQCCSINVLGLQFGNDS